MVETSLTASKLCEICRSFDIAKYFLPPVEGEAHTRSQIGELLYKSKELGTRKEISRRSNECTFCTLLYAATAWPGDEASITISSVSCGRNRSVTGEYLDPVYDIQVFARYQKVGNRSRIQLLADDADKLGLSRDFRAREPGMSGFAMRHARAWLDICCSKHGNPCNTLHGGSAEGLPSPQPQDLLAIDLVKMCICHKPAGEDYAALSYCWPSKAYLTLVKENRGELFEHGAVAENIGELPGTVQDAIECAKELPYRYLWIDALCIVQDDPDHKNIQLRQMDRVYSCASITLVRTPLDGVPQMLKSYEMALSFYTYRDVSYASDILNAFEGVKVVLSEAMGTDFWQGIPEKLLPQALCWQLRGPFRRRLSKPVGSQSAEPLFPSWTWAGWESSVNLNVHMAIQTYRTDAEWYIINKDGVATRLDVHPQWMTLSRQRPSPSLLKPFLPKLVPREEVDAASDAWRDARILGCWTTGASLFLDGSHHKLGSNNHETQWRESTNFAIKDPWGATAGCILLPKNYFQNAGLTGLTCEFILISRGLKSDAEVISALNMSYFDESVYSTRGWCHLNVMMISRIDEFTAERIGVGIISKEAWGAASPETTFVKLV
ncbi:heterokaryon incompatibility protein-domain-containing protein [Phaeosphaeria sp. MPI-PUGE-AT-0046c]|nr:heterokaryon incompatibility protein-domain-containing protein [Phaeosphaeria sp. MPI-PUGE-AT-0046c]